jgi:ubiquinone/menaquinone biosynthesis C-methylase UbiE
LSDDVHAERVQERFARTADRVAEREAERREALRAAVQQFVPLAGDERVVDSGAGTGALALALAPLVGEVVALDLVPELLELGRRAAAEAAIGNVSFVEGDATRMPFERGSFDLAACHRTLHHIARPELAVSELARVTRLGGRILLIDQIAPMDPLAALELDRFERARDPSHTRLLPEVDVRALLEANGLVLRASHTLQEGEARAAAVAVALSRLIASVGWYLAAKPVP